MLKIQVGIKLQLDTYGNLSYFAVWRDVFELKKLNGEFNQFNEWLEMVWQLSKPELKRMKGESKAHTFDDLRSRINVYRKLYARVMRDRIYYILPVLDSSEEKFILYSNSSWINFVTYIVDIDNILTNQARGL